MKAERLASLIAAILLCLAAAGCAVPLFRNYGRIVPSTEITASFENRRVDPGLRYYISGSDVYPNALMGLRRDCRLAPETLWKEVEMTPDILGEIVRNMQARASEYREYQYGFEISDNKGHPIGVWYSVLSARTFIRMHEDGTVRIDTPDLETYEKLKIKIRNF